MNELLNNADFLFSEVKGDFSSFWSMKQRGGTIEFITPYSTLGGDFISVFLTQRENGFVVSDGGRLQEIADEQCVDLETRARLHHADLLGKYAVSETFHDENRRRFHYKRTESLNMLSACVYDLAKFHEALANAIYLETLFAEDESVESRYFKTRVKELLDVKMKAFSTPDNTYVPFSDENTRHYHFAAGIREVRTDRVWLAMGISRSDLTTYQHMVRNAEYGFYHLRKKLPVPNCALASVLAPLPSSLQANQTAKKIADDMTVWKTDFGVENYLFEQIEATPFIPSIFPKIA